MSRWIRHPEALLDDCASRYGDPFTLPMPRIPPVVVISDPAAIKDVFTGDPEVLRSGQANAALQAMLGPESLLLLDGAEHLEERKLMLPPFHGERMRAYGDLIEAVAQRSIAGWPTGSPFPVAPHARAIALEVIMRAVFGVEERDRLERLGGALRRLLDTVVQPHRVAVLHLIQPTGAFVRTWRRWAPQMRPVNKLLAEEIRRRRSAESGDDILSMLLEARDEAGRPLSDEHLRDELLTLLVAGHETTAIGLTWALAHLARSRELADRAAQDDDFLDAVIKETLRLHPILTFSAVRDTTAPVEVGGRTYPPGVRLAISSYLLHKRPDLYPDPLAFRPERFVDQPAGTYTWVPFGGGRRRCLGASFAMFELRTILRTVLRAGDLAAAEPEFERDVRRGLALAPVAGGRLVFEPRQPAATERQPRSAAA
jgi:cytochrome P450